MVQRKRHLKTLLHLAKKFNPLRDEVEDT